MLDFKPKVKALLTILSRDVDFPIMFHLYEIEYRDYPDPIHVEEIEGNEACGEGLFEFDYCSGVLGIDGYFCDIG